ncbi:MAG: N-acetyltransferase [Bacteroidales bacterium]
MNSSVDIHEVNSRRNRKLFFRFPIELYRDHPYYVPPLLKNEKRILHPGYNPAYEFCETMQWLAFRDGKIAGRICGIINAKYNSLTQKKQARFSWFDTVNDQVVADSLLMTVENWAKSKGMKQLYGPYGFTSFDKHGVLVDGFDELATSSSNYNYGYYADLIQNAGFIKDIDWVEYEIPVPETVPEKMSKIAEIVGDRYGLKIARIISKKDLLKYKQSVFDLLNHEYSGLKGFVPLSERQIEMFVNNFFGFLDPDFVCIILDNRNEIAGFGISAPSISRALQKCKGKLFPFGFWWLLRVFKRNDTIDLLLIAIKSELHNKGVNALLFNHLIPNYQKRGIKKVETTQNQEDNNQVQSQWKYFNARLHKRSRAYIKHFD